MHSTSLPSSRASGPKTPQGVKDFRKILDDKSVDAANNRRAERWHTPATILACQAGKHVYVEKPGSHNVHESEMDGRRGPQVQPRRADGQPAPDWPAMIEAVDKLRRGAIGTVRSARPGTTTRGTIGKGKPEAAPPASSTRAVARPAPEQPLHQANLVHYNWHWHWHWGGGELGQQRHPRPRPCRWGLSVDTPKRITYGGGRYRFQDDQETPDTVMATFDFGDKVAIWDSSSCHPHGREPGLRHLLRRQRELALSRRRLYKVFDLKGKESSKGKRRRRRRRSLRQLLRLHPHRQAAQLATSRRARRARCSATSATSPTAPAARSPSIPKTRAILDDKEATAMRQRRVPQGWEPKA